MGLQTPHRIRHSRESEFTVTGFTMTVTDLNLSSLPIGPFFPSLVWGCTPDHIFHNILRRLPELSS